MFATQPIKKGTILETSPVIPLNVADRKIIEGTFLGNYIFEWGKTHRLGAMALGYVSMYNHDYSSNCEYEMDFDKNLMTIKTVKDVKKGEELCVNYNADPESKNAVWFDKNYRSKDDIKKK